MRKILLYIFVCLTVCANAQNASKSDKIIIIEGHFFKEKPVGMQNLTKMHILKTPKGTTAVAMELSEPLSDKALKYAIPIEQIPEGELLLERYKEAVNSGKGVSLKVGSQSLLKVGEKFPEFQATDINGRKWSSKDVEGKIMVLNLWFTGCGPCRAEMPELSTWKDEMPDVMFFSSTYEDADRARPVLDSRKFNWIPLVNDEQFVKFIGNNGYPMTVIVDKKGFVAKIEYGTSPVQREELKEKILQLR